MAEFQEVVRQYGRLCDSMHHCSPECPMHSLEDGGMCHEFMRNNPEGFEAVVMKWAADHPEKTLKDVLLEHFPNATLDRNGEPETCAALLGLAPCPNGDWVKACAPCTGCWNRPAPEEVERHG